MVVYDLRDGPHQNYLSIMFGGSHTRSYKIRWRVKKACFRILQWKSRNIYVYAISEEFRHTFLDYRKLPTVCIFIDFTFKNKNFNVLTFENGLFDCERNEHVDDCYSAFWIRAIHDRSSDVKGNTIESIKQ